MKPLLCLVATLCAAGFVQADQTIRSLQQTLKDKGLYYGSVTGEKSGETTAAIRRYQIRNGLKVTGEINDETLRSLGSSSNSVAGASQSSAKPAPRQPASIHPDATHVLLRVRLRRYPSNQVSRPLHPVNQVSRRLIHYLRQAFTNQRRYT